LEEADFPAVILANLRAMLITLLRAQFQQKSSLSNQFWDTFIGVATGAACCGTFVEEDIDLLVTSYG
jgi:hypothetical protein